MVSEGKEIGALRRLMRDDDPSLEEALINALGHRLQGVRIFAALTVAELFQDMRAVPGLAEALMSGDPKQRTAASSLLWECGDLDTEGLLGALYHAPADVRDAISHALYWIGWSPDDPDSAVAYFVTTQQWKECIALGREAIPGLLRALDDWDGAFRRGAAWALGEIGDVRAVEGLSEQLNDQQGSLFGDGARVCDIAAEALAKIGTEDALRALEGWRRDQGDGGCEAGRGPSP